MRYFRDLIYNPATPESHTILVSVFNDHENAPDQAYSIDIYTGTTHLVTTALAVNGDLFADNNGQIRLISGYNSFTGAPRAAYRTPSSD